MLMTLAQLLDELSDRDLSKPVVFRYYKGDGAWAYFEAQISEDGENIIVELEE